MTKEDAIQELRDMLNGDIDEYGEEGSEYTCEAVEMAIEALQERKTGKWIKRHYVCEDGKLDTFICSECRYECCYDAETGVSADDYKYCPDCGAKMEVDNADVLVDADKEGAADEH